jgi:hypothetical protein
MKKKVNKAKWRQDGKMKGKRMESEKANKCYKEVYTVMRFKTTRRGSRHVAKIRHVFFLQFM